MYAPIKLHIWLQAIVNPLAIEHIYRSDCSVKTLKNGPPKKKKGLLTKKLKNFGAIHLKRWPTGYLT